MLGRLLWFRLLVHPMRGETPVSERKKANSEFVPKEIWYRSSPHLKVRHSRAVSSPQTAAYENRAARNRIGRQHRRLGSERASRPISYWFHAISGLHLARWVYPHVPEFTSRQLLRASTDGCSTETGVYLATTPAPVACSPEEFGS
jgi:hypothetical protein